jgi:trafficking protein particle complex subunit 8
LLSPTSATSLYVQHALSTIVSPGAEITPAVSLAALSFAVRWETGINARDFLSNILEGDRWLVWATSSVGENRLTSIAIIELILTDQADEPPFALMYAQAAYLSISRRLPRRAALWYLLAANGLEKSGIVRNVTVNKFKPNTFLIKQRPLTMHFMRRCRELYQSPHDKQLSPSFWEADDVDPQHVKEFDSILPGIEYSLGTLMRLPKTVEFTNTQGGFTTRLEI